MRRLSLTQWIVISVVAGIFVGVLFQLFAPQVFQADSADLSSGEALIRSSFEFAKDLFLRMLKMIIVPLILTSIVAGVLAIGDGEGIGRIASVVIRGGEETLKFRIGWRWR